MKTAILYLACAVLIPGMSLAADIEFSKLSDQDWRNGVDIPRSDWLGKHLQGQDGNGGFYLSRNRAQIVSKQGLHIPLNVAAGIFFDINYSHPDKYQNYQLAWRFPHEGWSMRQAVHFQLKKQAGLNQKVFIPFSEIHSLKKIGLLQLKLDGCRGCKLYIVKTRIVGQHERENYEQYIPEKISYVHREPPPNKLVFKRIKAKLANDMPFFVLYGLLVIGVTIVGLVACFRFERQKRKP